MDNRRIPSMQTPVQVAAAQLADVLPVLPQRPVCLRDGGYGTTSWVQASAALPCDQLVRVAATRVLYRAAPPPTGKRGRPRQNGARFKGNDPATHGQPEATWTGTDDQGHAVTVRCWEGVHLKANRAVPSTAICLTRAAAQGTTRDPRHTWFWWLGGQPLPPLANKREIMTTSKREN